MFASENFSYRYTFRNVIHCNLVCNTRVVKSKQLYELIKFLYIQTWENVIALKRND